MSWRITKASPVAGVTPIHAGEVALRLEHAFDEAVSFGTIAAHLHLHPDELLADLLTIHSVASTEATRIVARLAIARAILGREALDDLLEPVDRGDSTVLIDVIKKAASERFPAVNGTAWRRRFPNWLVAHRGPSNYDNPVIIVARLSAGLQRAIDLRQAKWAEIHGFYEDQHDKMDALRAACEEIRKQSAIAVYHAAEVRKRLQEVIPSLNKVISLFTVMIAFWSELHGYPKKDEDRPELGKALRRRFDLLLLAHLYTQYCLTESSSAKSRDQALNRVQAAVEGIDRETAGAVASWDEYAPSDVWYEYHHAMRDCAAAVAAAPAEFAKEMIRKHFVHIFRALADKGAPACDPSALSDRGAQALLEAAGIGYDGSALASLDESSNPAFVMSSVSSFDLREALESTLRPVTRVESIADTVATLGPLVALYMEEVGASQSHVAGGLTRIGLALGGLDKDAEAHAQVFRAIAKFGSNPAKLAREVEKIHKKKIADAFKMPSDAIERTLYFGVALPAVKVLMNIGAVLARFDPSKKELTGSDYAAMAEAAADSLDVTTKFLLNRYGDALDELGDKTLVSFIKASHAKQWLEFVGKEGMLVVTSMIAIWTANEARDEKRNKGDLTGQADVQAAFFGVCLAVLSTVAPTAGFVVTVALGIAKFFASAASGTDAHTKVWYENEWKRISEKVWTNCKLDGDSFEEMELSDAYDGTVDSTSKRVRALHYIINSGQRVKSVEQRDSMAWIWSLASASGGKLMEMLRRHGFNEREIDFLRHIDRAGFGSSTRARS